MADLSQQLIRRLKDVYNNPRGALEQFVDQMNNMNKGRVAEINDRGADYRQLSRDERTKQMTDAVLEGLGSGGMGALGVTKDKGGQWLKGGVDRTIQKLKKGPEERAIAPIDEGGMTSYVVKDPSVLQRLEVKRPIIPRVGSGTPVSQAGVVGDLHNMSMYRLSKQDLGDTVVNKRGTLNLHAGPGLYGGLNEENVRRMYIRNEPWWVGAKYITPESSKEAKNAVKKLVSGETLTEEEMVAASRELNMGGLSMYTLALDKLKKPLIDVTEKSGYDMFREAFNSPSLHRGLKPPRDTASSEIFRSWLPELTKENPRLFDELPFSGVIHPAPGAFKKHKDVVVYEESPLQVLEKKILVPEGLKRGGLVQMKECSDS